MGRSDDRALCIAEQHWQTVGCQRCTHHTALGGETGVGFRRIGYQGGIDDDSAMRLREPGRFGRQQATKPRTVLPHQSGIVADMRGKMERERRALMADERARLAAELAALDAAMTGA